MDDENSFGVRAVLDERDEQEIEKRLRAALLARSEMVTHARLRPGVPPNAHTAGLKSRERRWGFAGNWRQLLIPVSVAAALAGGIFVGAALPDNSHSATSSAAASGGASSLPTSAAPTAAATASSPAASPAAGVTSFAGLTFEAADWKLTALDSGSACLAPQGHVAPAAGAVLPCGVDALYIKTGAGAASWPLSTAGARAGWWPQTVTSVTAIPCPGAASSVDVATSNLLRSTDKYALGATATAKYKEWMVSCSDGSGVVPRLWVLGTTQPVALAAVSATPSDDVELLAIVASFRGAK